MDNNESLIDIPDKVTLQDIVIEGSLVSFNHVQSAKIRLTLRKNDCNFFADKKFASFLNQ